MNKITRILVLMNKIRMLIIIKNKHKSNLIHIKINPQILIKLLIFSNKGPAMIHQQIQMKTEDKKIQEMIKKNQKNKYNCINKFLKQ